MSERAERMAVRGWLANGGQQLRHEFVRRLRRELPDVVAALGILLTVLVALALQPVQASPVFVLRVALAIGGALASVLVAEVLHADIPRVPRAAGAFTLFLLIFFANHVG